MLFLGSLGNYGCKSAGITICWSTTVATLRSIADRQQIMRRFTFDGMDATGSLRPSKCPTSMIESQSSLVRSYSSSRPITRRTPLLMSSESCNEGASALECQDYEVKCAMPLGPPYGREFTLTSDVWSGVHFTPVAPARAWRTSAAAQAWNQRLMGRRRRTVVRSF